jgi:CBS-domain-containing membrane protein
MASPASHRLARLPRWLSRWLGYRHIPPAQLVRYETCFWSFVAAFCGIALIQAVFGQATYFIRRGVPPIIASYVRTYQSWSVLKVLNQIVKGASAVLIYGAIETPLAQPRALLGGHFLGALTGVCITKLFGLLPTENAFQDLQWLCSSLSCAVAVVVMQLTRTTHPPAGKSSILYSL